MWFLPHFIRGLQPLEFRHCRSKLGAAASQLLHSAATKIKSTSAGRDSLYRFHQRRICHALLSPISRRATAEYAAKTKAPFREKMAGRRGRKVARTDPHVEYMKTHWEKSHFTPETLAALVEKDLLPASEFNI